MYMSERCKLPQRVWVNPAAKQFWGHFEVKNCTSSHFCIEYYGSRDSYNRQDSCSV